MPNLNFAEAFICLPNNDYTVYINLRRKTVGFCIKFSGVWLLSYALPTSYFSFAHSKDDSMARRASQVRL